MRKIVVLTFVSLDGVMQAPGGPEEDTSGDFEYGGWTFPYFDDVMGEIMDEQMSMPFDLLLGRRTYDIFAAYWPQQKGNPITSIFNKAIKYVVSHEPHALSWENSVSINGDVISKLKELRNGEGPILQVYGSSELIQALLKNDLVDELWLKVFPITLGKGKRLFDDGTIPVAFELTDSKVSPSGVIVANYKRAGNIQTGSFA